MLYMIKITWFVLLLTGMIVGCSTPTPLAPASTQTPAPTVTSVPTLEPGETEHILNVNGLDRAYVLHIPPGVNKDTPVPVVMVFHGLTYTVSFTQSQTHFDDVSDENRFILVYPKGIGTSWNSGGCCGTAVEQNVDDVEFVSQILSDLATIASIDTKRIYAAGFSNGAMLSYRLACEMSNTFAAIAPVEGPLYFSPCKSQQPVSVIHVHGLGDTWVPYAGGESTADIKLPSMPPVEQGIKTWVQLDGCTSSPEVKVDGAVTHSVYADCQANTAVELYTIDGLEHSWPKPSGSGPQNFPTTKTIWEFFVAHPKP